MGRWSRLAEDPLQRAPEPSLDGGAVQERCRSVGPDGDARGERRGVRAGSGAGPREQLTDLPEVRPPNGRSKCGRRVWLNAVVMRSLSHFRVLSPKRRLNHQTNHTIDFANEISFNHTTHQHSYRPYHHPKAISNPPSPRYHVAGSSRGCERGLPDQIPRGPHRACPLLARSANVVGEPPTQCRRRVSQNILLE